MPAEVPGTSSGLSGRDEAEGLAAAAAERATAEAERAEVARLREELARLRGG